MRALVTLAVVGALLRIRQFAAGRSLWLDEIALAHNLRYISISEIFTAPLVDNQSAPPGYLLAAKTSVRLFGTSEQALRLPALLGGLAAVTLAVIIARRLLTHRTAQLSFVALIAFAPALIYYSNEVKQYSTDVMATLAVLLLWTLRHHRRAPWILGVTGSLIAVLSLPGMIMLLALALALMWERLMAQRPWRLDTADLRHLTTIATLWTPGLGLHLAYTITAGTDRDFMRSWWAERNAFAPTAGDLLTDWIWYPQWLMRLVWVGIGQDGRIGSVADAGSAVLAIVMAVVVAGLCVWGLRHRHDLRVILLAPILLALILSYLRIYPTSGRLSLYLVPAVLLLAALGVDSLVTYVSVSGHRTRVLAFSD